MDLERWRVRCVFSESLSRQTLGVGAGGPPCGAGPRYADADWPESRWRAVVRVLRSPAGVARMLVDDVVTTLVPGSCKSCDGPLMRAGSVPVCEACVGRVAGEVSLGCGRCGEALDVHLGADFDMEDVRFASLLGQGLECRECRLASPAFEQAVSYATYAGELRILIQLLKFSRVKGVAKVLGPKLGEAILRLESVAAAELLVAAVPLFGARERERGYNQSVLLAEESLRWLREVRPEWKLKAANGILRRKKSTESSFVLSRKGRRRNMAGAFEISGDVRGREVLLVDDIYTTGATVRECARVLVRAGAAKVWVVTVARSQKGFIRRQHEDPGEYVAAWDLHLN